MAESGIREALTFDDVLLVPGPSDVLPADVDLRAPLTRDAQVALAAKGRRRHAQMDLNLLPLARP